MKQILLLLMISSISLFSQNLQEKKENQALQKAIDSEKKFAKEQKFYQGSEYDLKSQEVDMSSLDNIKVVEPSDDFDMDDVY